MALTLIHYDGFDDYSTAQIPWHWNGTVGTCSISSSYSRFGVGQGLQISGTSSISHAPVTPTASFLVSMAARFPTLPADGRFLGVNSDYFPVNVTGSGSIKVYRYATVLGESAAGVIAPNTWHHIAIAATIADSPNGKVDVWVDGVKVLTLSGVDTLHSGAATARTFQFFYPSDSWQVDDFALFTGASYTDADFPGDCRVFTDLPTGDGTYTAWTASAGADYSCVDENPATDDTDYISTSNANDIDTFTFPAIAGSGTVKGVMAVVTDRMDDAGPRSIALLARANAADVVGGTQAVASAYSVHRQLFADEPGGSGWAALTDVNATELGVKLIA